MPGRWADLFAAAERDSKPRVVSDFVAGMTDQFALAESQRLFDERPELG
jgi:dGTPase